MVTRATSSWLIAALLIAGLRLAAPVGCSDNEIKAIDRISQTGGTAGTGGDAGAGKAGSGGAAGMAGSDADSGLAGSSGKDGSAGSSGAGGTKDSGADGDSDAVVQDCASQCGADYCQGQTQGTDCSLCLLSLCVQAEARLTSALDAPDYLTCEAGCTDATCLDDCCNQYSQGCAAVRLKSQCACGYPATSCEAPCADSCTGTLTSSCEACARDTPCGVSVYDYDYTQDTNGHACMDGCAGDQTCVLLCCAQYPVACAAYQVVANCACGL
jgi:hypothetical protein